MTVTSDHWSSFMKFPVWWDHSWIGMVLFGYSLQMEEIQISVSNQIFSQSSKFYSNASRFPLIKYFTKELAFNGLGYARANFGLELSGLGLISGQVVIRAQFQLIFTWTVYEYQLHVKIYNFVFCKCLVAAHDQSMHLGLFRNAHWMPKNYILLHPYS